MAVHDLRKHIAWYLKGFPVGGSTRRAFMECENLEDVRTEIGKLDPDTRFPERVVDKPRGRVRFAKKVHLPYGWLESRETTHDERQALFGDDPMDASYRTCHADVVKLCGGAERRYISGEMNTLAIKK